MPVGPTRLGAVKIGGASLFSSGTEFERIRQYLLVLQRDPDSRWFVIFGGGDTVESMRTLHRNHPELDTQKMHWRCVDLLRATNDVAAELLDFTHRINNAEQLDAALADFTPRCYLVEVSSFYRPDLLSDLPLEHIPNENWDTTSDALAWLLALRLKANELQLIKKPDCSEIQSLEQAAELGVVDPQITQLARCQPSDWNPDTYLVYPGENRWNRKLLALPHVSPLE